jgi:hypothetical protein
VDFSPLESWQYLAEMSLIAISPRLERISGKSITRKQREFAASASNTLLPLLVTGWILVALDPIRVLHDRTRARKFVFKGSTPIKPPLLPSRRPSPTQRTRSVDPQVQKIADHLAAEGYLRGLKRCHRDWNPPHPRQTPPPPARKRDAKRGLRAVTRTKEGPNDWRKRERDNKSALKAYRDEKYGVDARPQKRRRSSSLRLGESPLMAMTALYDLCA